MTRLKGYIVTLDKDRREDDAKYILNAIRMIKGVMSVEPVEALPSDMIVESRVKSALRESIYEWVNKNL